MYVVPSALILVGLGHHPVDSFTLPLGVNYESTKVVGDLLVFVAFRASLPASMNISPSEASETLSRRSKSGLESERLAIRNVLVIVARVGGAGVDVSNLCIECLDES